MNLPNWISSLQFRLTLGFAVVLALVIAGVSVASTIATQRETAKFAREVEEARTGRAERLVNDAYEANQDWDQVQYTVQQVGSLFGWRVLVTDSDGYVVADSHRLARNASGLFDHLEERFERAQSMVRRPIIEGNRVIGTMFMDQTTVIEQPALRLRDYRPGFIGTIGVNGRGDLELRSNQSALPSFVSPTTVPQFDQAPADGASNTPADLAQEIALEPPFSRLEASFQQSIIFAGTAAGLAGLLIVSLFTRQALAPVRVLTGAARKLGSGDLSYRVPASRNDEVGQLARTFNEMASELESAQAQRRKMTADIAHELRTPLTNIQGYLEAIRDGVVEPDKETIATLHDQTVHLARLIDDLRLLSTAEAGALRLELNETSMVSLVDEAVLAFKPRAAELEIELRTSYASDLPLVNMDRTRMRQVVANLVENALTYTDRGGEVSMELTRAEPNLVRLAITDNGEGLSAQDLPRIFDQFYRVDQSRSRATGGAGLGLTIVKRLIEAHGGSIKVESTPGEGTTFLVDLPAAGDLYD